MELQKLRKADFLTSIIVILFGLFVTIMSLQMPMTASYGGVQSHWYVAPALFPLSIGVGLILLGTVLMIIAVKDGGLRVWLDELKDKSKKKISEKNIRVYVIMFAIGAFIYLFIPYIDFVLSISTFLLYICSIFYLENRTVFAKLTRFFIMESIILLILLITGIDDMLLGYYVYSLDVLALLAIAAMFIYARSITGNDKELRRKLRTVLLVAVITPLILCPLFRYPLLTPLPNEGIILDHLNLIYYAIKY